MINADAVVNKPTLAGSRVRLAPLEARHAPAVLDSLHDPETRRLTGTHAAFTLDQIERFCASRADQADRIDFAIEDIATGEYAGGLALMDVDPDNATAGFRVDLVEKFQGRGYGPEAIRVMLRYAFDEVGLHRMSLEVFDFNDRARRAYERCGFVLEGRLRDALLWEGERHDTLVMSMLRHDFVDAGS